MNSSKSNIGGSKTNNTNRKKKKQGGALTDDLKTLAVPFAILLAKQGIDEMKNKSKKQNSLPSRSSKSPSSMSRRKTMAGGNCGPCNGAGLTPPNHQSGGRMKKLSKAIDNFLKKY